MCVRLLLNFRENVFNLCTSTAEHPSDDDILQLKWLAAKINDQIGKIILVYYN